MDGLARFLGAIPPFCSLAADELEKVTASARVVGYGAGEEILDAFTKVSEDVFVVMAGQVELWTSDDGPEDPADEIVGRGGLFGYVGALTGATLGPRAVALTPARLVAVPRICVGAVFSSPAGARFLATDLVADRIQSIMQERTRTVDELVDTAPVLGSPGLTVAEAARLMTERSSSYVAVPRAERGVFGIVTDEVLRREVLAAGRPADTPIAEIMIPDAATARAGTPTADVLHRLAEDHLSQLLVVDAAGRLLGAVDPQDFLASPAGAGMGLHDRVRRAASIEQVVTLARQMPVLLGDLVRQRREASETTAIYSTVVDAIQRRVLSLVLARHPELDEAEVTWLLLGSNARREPTLGSDIDSAVVFAESVDTLERAAVYRAAFGEVADVLRAAGLRVDEHGANPSNATFSRTRSEWRAAAHRWREHPLDNKGMLFASLLIDGRPIQGDPGLPVVAEVFAGVRDHPGTLKLLVRESLTNKAHLRSVRDVLAGRGGTFDLKKHALRPIVEIARWAALAVRSPELSTRARLAAASGSTLLPTEQAQTLMEVFEVLQRIRLRQQLGQFERGEPVSDVVVMRRLPPLDRSLVGQSVREIATVQKRLHGVLQYTSPEEWGDVSP